MSAAPLPEFQEFNFDGLVGPTHHYGGLSWGNPASMQNRALVSNPRLAVRQGLAKMRCLFDLGVGQAIIPPLYRPQLKLLRAVGFTGTDQQVIEKAWRDAANLLSACCSASGMWTANAATIAPSCDTSDGRLHFTPANLLANLHRSFEAEETALLWRVLFPDPELFVHHPPLPRTLAFGDEGAANHNRMAGTVGQRGIHLFVYGREYFRSTKPARFPQRQTLEAAQAIARLHRLEPDRVFFVQQDPDAIEAGAFHNDVIATAHNELLLYHRKAFVESEKSIERLSSAFAKTQGRPLHTIEIDQFSLEEAVASYFFNSQIVTAADGKTILVAPQESREINPVYQVIQQLEADGNGPIDRTVFLNLRESMKNGGGPACLRIRIVLNAQERAAIPPQIFVDQQLFSKLDSWADRHYRDSLVLRDFLDARYREEVQVALDELSRILGLGSIYSFQKT
jgi:succinylarginine dihydrolase